MQQTTLLIKYRFNVQEQIILYVLCYHLLTVDLYIEGQSILGCAISSDQSVF